MAKTIKQTIEESAGILQRPRYINQGMAMTMPFRGAEICTGKSETLPGQVMRLRDIIAKYVLADEEMDISVDYGEDETFEMSHPVDYDLVDVENNLRYMQELEERLKREKTKIEENKLEIANRVTKDQDRRRLLENFFTKEELMKDKEYIELVQRLDSTPS